MRVKGTLAVKASVKLGSLHMQAWGPHQRSHFSYADRSTCRYICQTAVMQDKPKKYCSELVKQHIKVRKHVGHSKLPNKRPSCAFGAVLP